MKYVNTPTHRVFMFDETQCIFMLRDNIISVFYLRLAAGMKGDWTQRRIRKLLSMQTV